MSDRDDPLRGLWGWLLDWLQPELARLRERCDAALPGWDAEVRFREYQDHLDLMEWAAKEVDRKYIEDRRKLVVDWSWEWRGMPTGGSPLDGVDVDAFDRKLADYAGDHTL